MSKIATYLNEHLTGEVVVDAQSIRSASTDSGVLSQKPEMVANVASTSDIRKIARFSWQLAEKGHVLPLISRGNGTNGVSSAIGSGVIVSQNKYMNQIIGIDTKQRMIHVQAGASYAGVNLALSTHRGLALPPESASQSSGTVGGAIASGTSSHFQSRYGTVGDAVKQLEVVLANGDVLQTGKLSKRELNQKKGLHTFEGDIYRKIDNLISDNQDLVRSLDSNDMKDTVGYRSISRVKAKDGSFDLTPLFAGSQGTLGIVSEAIMLAQFSRQEYSVVFSAFSTIADAQSAGEKAVGQKASSVEIIDGRVLEMASTAGKKREFAPKEAFAGGLMVAIFDDYSVKNRQKLARKLYRQLDGKGAVHLSTKSYKLSELTDLYALISLASSPADKGKVVPEVFGGLWLPTASLDSFLGELKKLEDEYGIPLPVIAELNSGYVDLAPIFDLKKVSDRQKLVRTVAKLTDIVSKLGGSIAGHGGEGRFKSLVAQNVLAPEVVDLYKQIKQIFDPHGLLNPGVKQEVDTKELVSQLNEWCRQLG